MDREHFDGKRVNLSDDDWKDRLADDQFNVLRKKGTEPPFKNRYYDEKNSGVYECAGCGLILFSSETKYDSGTGWPSFFKPLHKENISFVDDGSLAISRTEVICSRCGGHLGHVFDDGPLPTRQRFCLNSTALNFVEQPKKQREEKQN